MAENIVILTVILTVANTLLNLLLEGYNHHFDLE